MQLIRAAVDKVISSLTDDAERREAAAHLYGVSALCALLAAKRGLNPETAAVSGLLHDLYRYKTGISYLHDESGAEMARVLIKRAGGHPETARILSAIFHHSDKAQIHEAYDELLKDADVLHHATNGSRVPHTAGPRLARLAEEFGLTLDMSSWLEDEKPACPVYADRRARLADVAEKLASRPIAGVRFDAEYLRLIRYWPEDEAFDELRNGWCAAFVYHCCQEAGFYLPIRLPDTPCRLAGVAAWYAWAQNCGFFFHENSGSLPERGDLVLYRNIIPTSRKPPESRSVPVDHIGVVLGCDGTSFTVAEGNVNHGNISGILTRPLGQNVEGFIRIPNVFYYGETMTCLTIPKMLNPEIERYAREHILPKYAGFDKAHRLDHVEKVIANSLAIAMEYGADINRVYVIAVYHDVGLEYGRDRHEETSGAALRADRVLRQWFSEDEITLMAEAVEDHRASIDREPRSLYGKIIAEADRDIEYKTILTRCIQYGLSRFPDYNEEQHFARVYTHMCEKYGENGYMKLWLNTEVNRRNLEELRRALHEKEEMKKDFLAIYQREQNKGK